MPEPFLPMDVVFHPNRQIGKSANLRTARLGLHIVELIDGLPN